VLVVNTELAILEALQKQYGGDIKPIAHRRKNWKPSWMWRLSWTPAVRFLEEIVPYLQIKDQQAYTAIVWDAARPGAGKRWDKESLELIRDRMRWLNQKGGVRGEDPIDPVLREIKTGQSEMVLN